MVSSYHIDSITGALNHNNQISRKLYSVTVVTDAITSFWLYFWESSRKEMTSFNDNSLDLTKTDILIWTPLKSTVSERIFFLFIVSAFRKLCQLLFPLTCSDIAVTSLPALSPFDQVDMLPPYPPAYFPRFSSISAATAVHQSDIFDAIPKWSGIFIRSLSATLSWRQKR